ncbi:hypothetical protein CRG98_038117 [Punica granatum]|uniref:Uncharacterized protein n=1 Tax=Punica granatum TaxID=22663 RepID=A0A2I0ICS2_PUNGR|nr:hypothetical protein CRG98_038117 [Punica granatum]
MCLLMMFRLVRGEERSGDEGDDEKETDGFVDVEAARISIERCHGKASSVANVSSMADGRMVGTGSQPHIRASRVAAGRKSLFAFHMFVLIESCEE